MKQIEKETILYQIEILKNYVKMYYELPDEEPTKFKKIIERLQYEAENFKLLQDINNKKAEESTGELTKTYHESRSSAYSMALKAILQVIKDFDGTNK